MGYSTVIAVLTGGHDDQIVLSAAADLAAGYAGLVKVLDCLPLTAETVWADAFGASAFSSAVGEAHTMQAKLRSQIAHLAERVAAKRGLAFGPGCAGARIELAQGPETAWLALMREAPLADLVVLGGSLIESDGFWTSVASEALLAVKLPMLIARSDRPVLGGRAAIFWDGSLSAGRAVRAAIPLLTAATHVTIFQDQIGLSAPERDAGEPQVLRDELARRGVTKVSTVDLTDNDEGRALLAAARADRARLIVSGGYGHSRLGEAMFGGATRTFVRANWDVNHFLAH